MYNDAVERIMQESLMFDRDFYLSRTRPSDDVSDEPFRHYLHRGSAQGKRPNRAFDPKWYIARNADLRSTNVEALSHYIVHGQYEGRPGNIWALQHFQLRFERSVEAKFQHHLMQIGLPVMRFEGNALYRYLWRSRDIGSVVLLVGPDSAPREVRRLLSELTTRDGMIFVIASGISDEMNFAIQSYIRAITGLYRLHTPVDDSSRREVQRSLDQLLSHIHLPICYLASSDDLLISAIDRGGILAKSELISPHLPIPSSFGTDRRAVNAVKDKLPVMFLSPDWGLSGVNTFVEHLAAGLKDSARYRPELILTQPISAIDSRQLPDIPIRHINRSSRSAQDIWNSVEHYLGNVDAGILIPNYDYMAASVIPNLPSRFRTIGIAHSDDIWHYEQIYRLGNYFDRIVAVSDYVGKTIQIQNASLASRLSVIRYGINALADDAEFELLMKRRLASVATGAPLKVVFAGRLERYQKRVDRLPALVRELTKRRLNFVLKIIGEGSSRGELEEALSEDVKAGRVQFLGRITPLDVVQELRSALVLALVSEFEGLPLVVLEALSMGVPVMSYAMDSGIPEVITDGESGIIVPADQPSLLADRFCKLVEEPAKLREMMNSARASFFDNKLSSTEMVQKYVDLFDDVMRDDHLCEFRRPKPLIYGHFDKQGYLPPPTYYRKEG